MTPPIASLIRDAHGHAHAPGTRPPKRRVVVRIDAPDVTRLDALRGHFPEASRASLVRAFIAFGLLAAEEHVKATPPAAPEGGAS